MCAICYFRIFATPWKLLAFFAEVSVFLINYCTDFQKLGTNGKVCCFSMCLHALLVFFLLLTPVLGPSKASVGGFLVYLF